jgi:hypothetical protein
MQELRQEIKDLNDTLNAHDTPNSSESTVSSDKTTKPTDIREDRKVVPPAKPENLMNENLLIGDSMVRDISEKGLNKTTVDSISGGKVQNVKESLLKHPHLDQLDTIMIHVGTNNCTSDSKVTTGITDYESMINKVQERAPNTKLVLSTICPRVDDEKRHQQRVDKMNTEIRKVANDKGCVLVDNDNNFKHSDLNERGLHLRKSGTRRLLMNLNAAHGILKVSPKRDRDSNETGRWKTPKYNRPSPRARTPSRPTFNDYHGRDQGPRASSRPNHNSYGQDQGPRVPRGCYFCGASNHVKRNCRYGQPIQCFGCGEYGHKAHQNVCNVSY